ncbi:MAG: cache domain-containing protein [Arcobacter sp.]|uniref:sensor histidine kinase n=1 Tax=Arcobacter sp. TaxID=1872629 RepID=UPI003B003BED
MNILKNEKSLLNFIRYGAIICIIVFSFIVIEVVIYQKKQEVNDEIKKQEEGYISHNKIMVENLVNKAHKLIDLEREFEKEDFKNLVKEEVYQAHAIATLIYNKNIKRADYSKAETIQIIKSALKAIRFNNNGYIFIYKMSGENILNAGFPNLEGKNLWDFQDSKGTYILKEMNEILSNKDETFYEWYWKKTSSDKKEGKKIGFFKKFEPYDLFIGAGYYEEDFKKQTQKRVLKKLNSFELKKPEHIFLYDLKGLCLVNPKKELIGLNRYDVKNSDGKYTLRDIIDYTKKNKEGFIKYTSTVKLNTAIKSNDKMSFVKLYEDWDWMIGSGFYLEELESQIEEKKQSLILSNEESVKNIILIGLIITIIVILSSFYLSKTIFTVFREYRLKIYNEMKNSLEKEKLLTQQSKMATMGEMIGSIAHQWKQPLSVISMANGLLRINREMKDFSTQEEIDSAIDDIDESIHNLSQTIDDFRNFFNPNKEKSMFKISDAIDDTLKLISSQLRNNNIEVISNIKDVEFFGSKNELLQTLINLFKNAKEELVKMASIEKRYIFVDVYKEKSNITIKIRDNASGIPSEIIDNIFDAHYTTKEKDGGTGIGLYISKQIIEESMKGKISALNVDYKYEGKTYTGAEFTILLPFD